MTISKVMSTHLALEGNVLHVEGTRAMVLWTLRRNAFSEEGIDLPILIKDKNNPKGPYYRTHLWLGLDLIRRSMIANDHEVEVTDEPYVYDNDDPSSKEQKVSSELEVEL